MNKQRKAVGEKAQKEEEELMAGFDSDGSEDDDDDEDWDKNIQVVYKIHRVSKFIINKLYFFCTKLKHILSIL